MPVLMMIKAGGATSSTCSYLKYRKTEIKQRHKTFGERLSHKNRYTLCLQKQIEFIVHAEYA